MDIVNLEGRG